MKKSLPARWMITDSKTIDPIAAAKNLPKDSGIILRDYDLGFEKRFTLGIELKKISQQKKIPLLIAGDAKLALKLNADGVHFPEFARAQIRRWKNKKPEWIITASTHSRQAVKFAYENGADAVLVSPIFSTASDLSKKPLGIFRARNYINNYIYKRIFAYALGGVQPHHEKALRMADFCGFAGISWVKNCGCPATVAQPRAKK